LGKIKILNHPSPPFKEKEKDSEDRSKAWWPMEGEGKGFFLPFSISPQTTSFRPSFFIL